MSGFDETYVSGKISYPFAGLRSDTRSHTALDGMFNSWWFAVASFTDYNKGFILGPLTRKRHAVVKIVELYVVCKESKIGKALSPWKGFGLIPLQSKIQREGRGKRIQL